MAMRNFFFIAITATTFLDSCSTGLTENDLSFQDASSDLVELVSPHPVTISLTNWRIASSTEVGLDGAVLSSEGYDDSKWVPARVPGTVFGALVDAKLFDDPFYGTNLQRIPGWTLSFLPMPEDSPYAVPWWWRTEFDLPDLATDSHIVLVLEGVNYAADVYVNGQLVATKEDVIGTFREHYLDITGFVTSGQKSAMAILVYAPDIFRDLAIYFVDWNPEPPDYSMGLWMPVHVDVVGPVSVRHPGINTRLNSDGSADLTLLSTLVNHTETPLSVTLGGMLDELRFETDITLAPNETREIALGPDSIAALHIKTPRLWWPYQYGEPYLYHLELTARVNGMISDRVLSDVGLRQVTAEIIPPNQIMFSINGRPILIRGAGYVPDMFYRHSPERDRAEIAYVKHIGLNALRLEGKFLDHSFYAMCDREGILLMPGLCCCDAWEDWENWVPGTLEIAKESLKSQLHRLRRHASVFTWLNGSDFHPPPEIERAYLSVASDVHWDLPIVSSATEQPSDVSGPSGMKMTGPYNWVPPNYWYLAVPGDPMSLEGKVEWEWMYGGAFGFNSESSPGYSVPPLDSLLRMMAPKDIWPPGDVFLFHSGTIGSAVGRLSIYRDALEKRLGSPVGLADFVTKAQVIQYEAHRAMFEAQGRNKYFATGHIQWMANQAWPGLIWQLWDYYLRPGGTFYGARKALRPLHVQYSYDDHSVWVINSTLQDFSNLKVVAQLWRLDGSLVVERQAFMSQLEADGNKMALTLAPDIVAQQESLAPVYFAALYLQDESGQEIDRNIYWLAVDGDVYEWGPNKDNLPKVQVADMKALSGLLFATLYVPDCEIAYDGDTLVVLQTIENRSDSIAFFVEALLLDAATDKPILPVLWNDNYVTLMPKEKVVLQARAAIHVVEGRSVTVSVSGWNTIF